jgi:Uncharacterized conserved protein, COG2135
MCGRFTQKRTPKEYAAIFRATSSLFDWTPRYNLSPGQQALALRKTEAQTKPELVPLLWGLVPHWAKEKGKYSTINARVETIDTKPAYRYAFRHKRCIIPGDGYFEWEQLERGKQPWYFHRPDDSPLALAGLWDTWTDPDGNEIESFTIIVRPAIPGISDIHDRMPAVLPEEMWEDWLNPDAPDVMGMKEQLMVGDPGSLEWYRVSRVVNSSRSEGPELLKRI